VGLFAGRRAAPGEGWQARQPLPKAIGTLSGGTLDPDGTVFVLSHESTRLWVTPLRASGWGRSTKISLDQWTIPGSAITRHAGRTFVAINGDYVEIGEEGTSRRHPLLSTRQLLAAGATPPASGFPPSVLPAGSFAAGIGATRSLLEHHFEGGVPPNIFVAELR
jgi:hypothetical protein